MASPTPSWTHWRFASTGCSEGFSKTLTDQSETCRPAVRRLSCRPTQQQVIRRKKKQPNKTKANKAIQTKPNRTKQTNKQTKTVLPQVRLMRTSRRPAVCFSFRLINKGKMSRGLKNRTSFCTLKLQVSKKCSKR